jgi:ParB family transcriptional regulator, chromosome partitioning protein
MSNTTDVSGDTDNLACTSGSSPPVIKRVKVEDVEVGEAWQAEGLDTDTVAALADSIPMHGMLHPITVRARGDRYTLVAGRHRLEAAKRAGLREVEVKIVDVDDDEAMAMGLVENLRRRKLSASDETAALVKLLAIEACMTDRATEAHDERRSVPPRNTGVTRVARKTGKSKTAVTQAASRLKKAHPDVLAAFKAKRLKAAQVDELIRLEMSEQAKLLPVAVGLTRDQLRARVDEALSLSQPIEDDAADAAQTLEPEVSADRFIATAKSLLQDVELIEVGDLDDVQRHALRELSDAFLKAFRRLSDSLIGLAVAGKMEEALAATVTSADEAAADGAVAAEPSMGRC